MEWLKKKMFAAAAAGTMALAANGVNAAVVFNYSVVATGDSPTSTAPWLTGTFANGTGADAGSVLLTLQSSLEASGEFITDIFFNFNPAKSLSALNATIQPLLGAGTYVSLGFDKTTPPPFQHGGNSFDFAISFDNAPPNNRFNGTVDKAVFKFTSTQSISENDFAFLSDANGNNTQYYSLAHVQGIAGPDCPARDPNCSSGWVSPEDPFGPTEVPLPAAAWLFLSGLVPLAGFLRKRREVFAV
jgi:hypothetical protein